MYSIDHLTYILNNNIPRLNISLNQNMISEMVSICKRIVSHIKSNYSKSSETSIQREGCIYRNDLIKTSVDSFVSNELQEILNNDSDTRLKNLLEHIFAGLIKPILNNRTRN